jgi:uncharacterized phiE125 gp8 family phage protein
MESPAYYGLTLLTPPTGEPVTLAEAREWVRVDPDDAGQDRTLRRLIRAAREAVERYGGRQLVSAKWRRTLRCFPPGGVCLSPWPLQAVTAVAYYDVDEAQQTLATTYYDVDTSRERGGLWLADGQAWPSTYYRPDAVTVDFWAGHGPVTATQAGFEAGSRTVTPNSMDGIYAGTALVVGDGDAEERIVVTSVASTTFTATFARGHPDPCDVRPALPEQALHALQMLVCRWYEHRGDLETPDAMRAEEAVGRLLRKTWPEGVA